MVAANSKSNDELLNEILTSGLPIEDKAKAILTIRHTEAQHRQNSMLLVLTLIASLSTLVQAAGVIRGFMSVQQTAAGASVPPNASEPQSK
jgi:hypothetical protein